MAEYWLEIESGMEEGPYSPEELRQKLQHGECHLEQYVVDGDTNDRCRLRELTGVNFVPVSEVKRASGDEGASIGKASDYFVTSLDYRFGKNGRERDYQKAAEYARLGHEQGDLNCTALLCECYRYGEGVPRDFARMLGLANEMAQHQFAAGWQYLAEAYSNGYGVPMDMNLFQVNFDKAVRAMASSVPGMNEDVRYDALFKVLCLQKDIDWEVVEKYCREYLPIAYRSDAPCYLIPSLLTRADSSPSVRQELRQILDVQCGKNVVDALVLKAMLLANEEKGIYTPNADEAKSLVERAAVMEQPSALLLKAQWSETQDEAFTYLNRMWDICRHGESKLHRSNELPCAISIRGNKIACLWRVYEHSVAAPNFNPEGVRNLIVPLAPAIVLKNESSMPLSNVTVRICAQDIKLDRTIRLETSIAPGQEIELEPLEHDIELENDLYVEVRSGTRYADLLLPSTLQHSDFATTLDSAPPLAFWWEKGFFGGYVLRVACFHGSVSNIVISKQNAKSEPFSLNENSDPAKVGWAEFSDSAGLAADETFVVSADNFPLIVGRILTTADDKGTAGWLKVAGGAAAFIGGAVLGS